MKAEADPITPDEWLLRRVRVEKFRSAKVPFISPGAFEPRVKGRDPDTDGISLYRAACLADPVDILATVEPARLHEYGIVGIPVSLFTALNLTVEIRPDDRVRGHVVIRELNSVAFADKGSGTPLAINFTFVLTQLATAASEDANIVRRPAELPPP